MQQPLTLAVIELASYSVSVFVARCTPDHLEPLVEKSTLVGLRESVRATGEIAPEARDNVLTAVREYQALAREHGAEHIWVVAHKAVREAGNSASFLAAIRQETGISISILSGTVTAALAFLGATYGPDLPPDTGVLDVGPGSVECIAAQNRHMSWLTSVPKGSGWLHDQYLSSNPPTPEEVERALCFLHMFIPGFLPRAQVPPALVVTGSTAKLLLKMGAHGDRFTYQDLLGYRKLLSLSAEALAQRYAQPIERAHLLPAGVLIILEVMSYCHLDTIRLSSRGLAQGVLLAYARHGENWIDHPFALFAQSLS